MTNVVSGGLLRGRPFGGTAILLKESFSNVCNTIYTFERVVAITICDLLLINNYMPCEDGSIEALNSLNEVIANASNIIEESSSKFFLFGGDLNVNLNSQTPHAMVINDFLNSYNLNSVVSTHPSMNIEYTFINEKLNRHSTIDFLCLSDSLLNHVNKYNVLNEATNHSDHLPLTVNFTLPIHSNIYEYVMNGNVVNSSNSSESATGDTKSLRWDKGDCDSYYNMTRDLLYPVYNTLNQCIVINHGLVNETIEQCYCHTVNALTTAADQFIATVPQHISKHWWNSDLSNLKKQSINSHNLWLEGGKPLSGITFENKNKDKLRYKLAIKTAKVESDIAISDKLHEDLTYKNTNNFWKTWKNKVCSKAKGKVRLEGNIAPQVAVEKFANYFKIVNSPNSAIFDLEKREEFQRKLKQYNGDALTTRFLFSAEVLAIALSKMETGKSPGFDGITVDHIVNCHPVVISILSKLFNEMIKNGYVPSDFGKGITIPIPKNENTQGAHSIDSFRGITLSPVISKLFEHGLLLLFADYFVTSDNQFGFKPKIGCPHAIYTVRKIVEYYVTNNSTINMCFLDIAKGFDKINIPVLLMKLMKRCVPVSLVKLLYYWYSISMNCVRWENVVSTWFNLLAGIRQGGGA